MGKISGKIKRGRAHDPKKTADRPTYHSRIGSTPEHQRMEVLDPGHLMKRVPSALKRAQAARGKVTRVELKANARAKRYSTGIMRGGQTGEKSREPRSPSTGHHGMTLAPG